MNAEQQHALDLVLELDVLMGQDMSQSLARDGLTEARAAVLWELHQRGPVTGRTLAEARGVSARNITGLIDGLVAGGFVTREAHPTDRRASLISFTERGTAIAAEFERGQAELAELFFGGMRPARFQAFSAGLEEVLTRLRARLAEDER